MKLRTLAGSALVLLGLAWAGPQDNSLVVGASQEPKVLAGDFLNVISNQAIKNEIEDYLFGALIAVNPDGQNVPVLVTELPTLANKQVRSTDIGGGKRKLEIDLTLRQGLKWSDGKPLTTDDVAFFYEVGKAKGMPVLNPDYWERVSLKVKDGRNFTVTFQPAIFSDLIGSPISYAPAHLMRGAWNGVKAQAAQLNPDRDAERLNELYRNFFQGFSTPQNLSKMAYSGPFTVNRWVPGSSLELRRNPNFALTPPGGANKYVQRVTYRFIQNTNSLLLAVLGGSIDATSVQTGLNFDQARSPQLTGRARNAFDIWFVPQALLEHLSLNQFNNLETVKNLGLNDKRTRQALMYAMNREGWVKAFFGGLEPVANSFLSPVNPHYNASVTKYPYNPTRAKEILAQLGWKPGPDGILQRTVNGKTVRFEIEFVTTAGNTVRERSQQFLADNLKQVGIAVRVNNAPSATVFSDDYIQRAYDGRWSGMLMFGWGAPLGDDGGVYACSDPNTKATFVPTPENNYTGQNINGWCNAEFDRLRARAQIEFDPAKRKQIFAQMQKIWADELPELPLRYRSAPVVVRKGLVNYVAGPYSGGYPGAYGNANWQAHLIGWQSKGAQKVMDQAKYAEVIK